MHFYFYFQDISLENVSSMYELSEALHAMSLRQTCILFILEQFDKLSARPGYVLFLTFLYCNLSEFIYIPPFVQSF